MKKEEYEWTLELCGQPADVMRAAESGLSTYYLWRDAQARLVDRATLLELEAQGKVAPLKDYWQVRNGNLGVVCLTRYCKYTTTWDLIKQYVEAFAAGYTAGHAAGKRTGVQQQKQWCADEREAYKLHRKINRIGKKMRADGYTGYLTHTSIIEALAKQTTKKGGKVKCN